MNRAARWGWTGATLALIGAALALAFVLSLGAVEPEQLERGFARLFWINVAVAGALLLIIGWVLVRLALRLRSGRFGSRLLIKLAGIFALVGVLPGVVIYAVSWQFASRSIESWFDERVAQALDAGLSLGRETLQSLQSDLALKATVAASRWPDSGGAGLALERLREQLGAREVALVAVSGQIERSASLASAGLAVDRPSAQLLREARSGRAATAVEGLEEGGSAARVRALAPLPGAGFGIGRPAEGFLLVTVALPPTLARNALAVQAAYSEYQQRALAREALRRMYIGSLTLALVLAVFGAMLLAIVLGNQITRPLLMLADGVREVASGNLSARPVFPSADELGGLTRSFADMTRQVADARHEVQRGVTQLESARTRLQTILDNLTAGVIVFDREQRIDTVNPGATRILREPMQVWVGRRLEEVPSLQAFSRCASEHFEALGGTADASEREQWQDAFEFGPGAQAGLTVLLRGAMLPGATRLLVFDDITEVVSAQRARAWAEVARRLAHEIKNPLTPIQLSAERLQHKLHSQLDEVHRAMLERSVATIVDQVEALKLLVNEFRDYARLPSAHPRPLQLNELVRDVAALYAQELESGRLRLRLWPPLPGILGDAAQLRQVVHNLVQNALDAVQLQAEGRVEIATEAVRADDGSVSGVRLLVQDNGPGFAEDVLGRAFEPYVTTKPRGTGLGLALVKKIADEHRARLRALNLRAGEGADAQVIGARVSISFFALVHDPSLLQDASAPGARIHTPA